MKEAIKNNKRQTIGYTEQSGTKVIVYDSRYRRLGEIRAEVGKQVAYDSHYKRLAVYDEKTGITKDSRFIKIGNGNLLLQIIFQNM